MTAAHAIETNLISPEEFLQCELASSENPLKREVLSGLDATLDLPEVSLSIPFADLYEDVQL